MRIALVSIGIAAALVASGSATVEQAQSAGMALLAATALVVLLEVVNVVGTWTWLVDPDTRIQWEAAIGVGAASLVTAICGVLSYGLIGLVAPVGVLFTVHLVGRLTHRRKLVEEPAVDRSTAVDKSVDAPAPVTLVEPLVAKPIDPPTEPIDLTLVSAGPALVEPRRPEAKGDDEAGKSHSGEGDKQQGHSGKAKRARQPQAPKPTRGKVHDDPAVREAAARIIAESETRPSESRLLAALSPQFPGLTKYGCKVLLGYKTTGVKAPELEAVS